VKISVFKNLTLKLVALILSIIIWFLVVGEQKSEVRLTVPLELRNLPTNLEIIESISQVEVALRGFSSFVKRLTPTDIDVHIDLSNVVKGTNAFAISLDDIAVPIGATVIQVSPSTVDVLLDATLSKLVPVDPNIRGVPASGYILGKVSVEPKNITITGIQSIVKTISKVETEPVVLDNPTKDLLKKVKVRLPNRALQINNDEEKIVSVSVKIIPEMTTLSFENIPLLVKDESRKFTLSPESITALVNGPKLQLSQMSPEDIPAYIETSSLPEGQSIVQPTFELPESMSVTIHYPKTITITIAVDN